MPELLCLARSLSQDTNGDNCLHFFVCYFFSIPITSLFLAYVHFFQYVHIYYVLILEDTLDPAGFSSLTLLHGLGASLDCHPAFYLLGIG